MIKLVDYFYDSLESKEFSAAIFVDYQKAFDTVNHHILLQKLKAYGIRGNIFQKAYFVNTYLFPKLWFTAQFCKLDNNIIKKILSKALAFIYAGENEKPVNSVNFRSTSEGGLGLINPFHISYMISFLDIKVIKTLC